MTPPPPSSDHAVLVAELSRLTAVLLGNPAGDEPLLPGRLADLCGELQLSHFERDLLLLAVGWEVDGALAAAVGHVRPTLGFALARLPNPHWDALSPDGALRRLGLLELGDGDGLVRRTLIAPERLVHHLLGGSAMDPLLTQRMLPVAPAGPPPASYQAAAAPVVDALGSGELAVVQLLGDDSGSCRQHGVLIAGMLGLELHAIAASDLPIGDALDAFVGAWNREAYLGGRALLISLRASDRDDRTARSHVDAVCSRLLGPLFVDAASRWPLNAETIHVFVQRPSHSDQRALWEWHLPDHKAETEALAAQFDLGPEAIERIARAFNALPNGDNVGATLRALCRTLAGPEVGGSAERIETRAGWESLILPETAASVLREMVAQVRHRHVVLDQWGMRPTGGRGGGIVALFAGPSGTGKTLAAEVIAHELGMELYRVDLASVMSKYIGETERNLRAVFDAADATECVLLFDEADTLFGSRSEVRDSNDRYANLEVSYLLQRLESFRGVAILTTNLRDHVDTAFVRRFRFVVEFPYPDEAARRSIWHGALGPDVPTRQLDTERLARLPLSGAEIRNAAVAAAFLAVRDGSCVTMGHVRRAIRAEYAKTERPINERALASLETP